MSIIRRICKTAWFMWHGWHPEAYNMRLSTAWKLAGMMEAAHD